MNSFAKGVWQVCSALMLSGVVLQLGHKAYEKSMRFVVSLVVISVLVSAVSCAKEAKLPAVSTEITSDYGELASLAAEQSVRAVLKDNGITYTYLQVYTDKNKDGSIYISRITVRTDMKDADVAGILQMNFVNAQVVAEYE